MFSFSASRWARGAVGPAAGRSHAVEGLLGYGHGLSQYLLDCGPRISLLALGGQDQAGQHGLPPGTGFGTIAKGNFAQDHTPPQGLFGLVVGRLYLGMPQKGEEIFLLFPEAAAQLFGGFPGEFLGAESL